MAKKAQETGKFRAYYLLTKPGIIRGNILVAAGGFLFAARGHVDILLLLATLIGTSLVIASACVLNNYIDRDIDTRMERTKKRALVTGFITPSSALIYAAVLGISGTIILFVYVNALTGVIGLFGFFAYVVLYTYAKRLTTHGTVIGSISGAIPPVAGYAAVTNYLDVTALLLFIILVAWQMPHFYAIAVFRQDEYAAAKIPVLPVKKGLHATKIQITLYIIAFTAVCVSLGILSYASTGYLIVMTGMSLLWLRLAIKGFKADNDHKWAREVFGMSLLVILVFSIMLSLNSLFS
ncbi:MAG: heme o synthase [Patescibacteria group bacterium]|nr:heme o synthase [Patescibacteria group bacterium]